MEKPHSKSTLKYMREYIKENELNKKQITLGLKKPEMIKRLKELGHWNDKNDSDNSVPKSVPKPTKITVKKTMKKKEEPVLKIEDKPKFKVLKSERARQIKAFRRETGSKKTPLQILGIKPKDETPELVKKRCRQLQLKNHPDKKGGNKEMFNLVRQSCELLMRTVEKV